MLDKLEPYAAWMLFRFDDEENCMNLADAARMYFSNNGPLVGTGNYKPTEGLASLIQLNMI